jgi:flagellar hook-length control protein FliK
MFSLNFVPKNEEIKLGSTPNTKTSPKGGNKDFLQILEGQKSNIKNSNIETKEESKVANTVEKQNKSIEKEKTMIKGDKKEDKVEDKLDKLGKIEELGEINEDEMKLITVLQNLFSLYNVLEDLDIESNKLIESVFQTMEVEMTETLTLLEELINNPEFISNESSILEAIDKVEEFVKIMEVEIEEYKIAMEEDLELPLEKKLVQLEKGMESLKPFVEKSSKVPVEDEVEFKNNLEDGPNIIENTSIEIENTAEEDFSNNREDIGTDFPEEEDIEIDHSENPVPSFEIKNQGMYRKTNILGTEKPQNIDTKEIIEQIVDKAKLAVDDFKQEIKISLKPEILGDVILKMETAKEGITTKIMVDNYKTKELIETNLYQLKEEMKENGLEIKAFEVFVGTNEDFQKEKSREFNLNKKSKKIKIKDEEVEEIKTYDNNVFRKMETIYGESKLNLFA